MQTDKSQDPADDVRKYRCMDAGATEGRWIIVTIQELKEQVWLANLELKALGLAIFTWGNASGVDRESGLVAIKPSGVAYESMKAADMVVVDLEGKTVEGSYKPSSDLPTHLVLYREFPELGGVAHSHSTYATAIAQAGRDLPAEGTTHADHFYGAVPCTRPMTSTEIEGAYEHETGRVIVETFKARGLAAADIPAVLVHGHGPFSWGSDPLSAVHNAAVLEEVSRMAILSRTFGGEIPPGISQSLLDKHYLRKHGKNAYYGQGKH
jgi:L-ribulose-5-phosphate 4-epimerase